MLKLKLLPGSPYGALFDETGARLEKMRQDGSHESPDLILTFGEKVELNRPDSKGTPLSFDYTAPSYLNRLRSCSLRTEALGRAALAHLNVPDLVLFDATAGMGRDSLILARLGAQVIMFERHPAVRALLTDALTRARQCSKLISLLPRGLPVLAPEPCFQDSAIAPDVIYYDPMFPQRSKSAAVKKEMQYFHALIGFDEDTAGCFAAALARARRRVVVKRPAAAAPLAPAQDCAVWNIAGGICRFDCYQK